MGDAIYSDLGNPIYGEGERERECVLTFIVRVGGLFGTQCLTVVATEMWISNLGIRVHRSDS